MTYVSWHIKKELIMKFVVAIIGLLTLAVTNNVAVAGSCGGGDHTHSSDNSDKKKGTGI